MQGGGTQGSRELVGVLGGWLGCTGVGQGTGGLAEVPVAQSAGGVWMGCRGFRQGTGPWQGYTGNSWDTREPVGVQRDQAGLKGTAWVVEGLAEGQVLLLRFRATRHSTGALVGVQQGLLGSRGCRQGAAGLTGMQVGQAGFKRAGWGADGLAGVRELGVQVT